MKCVSTRSVVFPQAEECINTCFVEWKDSHVGRRKATGAPNAARVCELVEINISRTFYFSGKSFDGFDDEMFFFRGNLKQSNLHMYFGVFILLCCFSYIC